MPTRLWLILALLILAIVSWNIVELSTSKKNSPPISSRQLDFYATGIDTLKTDSQGQPKNRLVATKMLHFEKDGHTELEQPVATLFATDSSPWVITAERGRISSGGDIITMTKKVHITREADKTNQSILITTESLIVEPDRDYVETSDPIRLVSDNHTVESVGMKANIKKPMQINLLSKVREQYEPR